MKHKATELVCQKKKKVAAGVMSVKTQVFVTITRQMSNGNRSTSQDLKRIFLIFNIAKLEDP